MDSLSGGYNIAYPRRNQVLVAKDGALDFSGNWDGATIVRLYFLPFPNLNKASDESSRVSC
jgi:hypothetical protein